MCLRGQWKILEVRGAGQVSEKRHLETSNPKLEMSPKGSRLHSGTREPKGTKKLEQEKGMPLTGALSRPVVVNSQLIVIIESSKKIHRHCSRLTAQRQDLGSRRFNGSDS